MRLKELRKKHNLTQKQLAAMISVAQSTYSDYENAELNIPSEQWLRFADIYGVSVDYMMGLTDNPTRNWSKEGSLVAEIPDPSKKKN